MNIKNFCILPFDTSFLSLKMKWGVLKLVIFLDSFGKFVYNELKVFQNF